MDFDEEKKKIRDKIFTVLPTWLKKAIIRGSLVFSFAGAVISITSYFKILPPYENIVNQNNQVLSLNSNQNQSNQQKVVINEPSQKEVEQSNCDFKYCSTFSSEDLQSKWMDINNLGRQKDNQDILCAAGGGKFPIKTMKFNQSVKPNFSAKLSLIPADPKRLNTILQYSNLYRITIGDGDLKSVALHYNESFPNLPGNFVRLKPTTSSGEKGFLKNPMATGNQSIVRLESQLIDSKSQIQVGVTIDDNDQILFQILNVGIKNDFEDKLNLGFYVEPSSQTCARLVKFDLN